MENTIDDIEVIEVVEVNREFEKRAQIKRSDREVTGFKCTISWWNKEISKMEYITLKEVYKNESKAKKFGQEAISKYKVDETYKNCRSFKCQLKKCLATRRQFNETIALNSLKDGEVYAKKWNIIRKNKKYSIEEVLNKYTDEDIKIDFDGDLISMNSHRYANFKFHGTTCVCCGLVGQYFYKDRRPSDDGYHFNLYGIDKNGIEVMMTKDHVNPRSAGGENVISNYQPLCERCNINKGSKDDKIFKSELTKKQMQGDMKK